MHVVRYEIRPHGLHLAAISMPALLFAQVFAWCVGNVFYDAPNGNIVEIKGQPNISYSAVLSKKWKQGLRPGDPEWAREDSKWAEVMFVDRGGSPIVDQIYWHKRTPEYCLGEFIGR